ncbi:MAG TPA: HEAT repeat domain-containing protein [Planctomycetes bacterium]|nr:HEAT repeat domain-containing protein [Planctomycetota bacterium]
MSGRRWEDWWKIAREGFLARRARLPLGDPGNQARTVVVMKDAVETVVFIPKGSGEKPGPGEKAVYLLPADQAALVERLLNLGLQGKASTRGGGLVAGGRGAFISFVLRLDGREMIVRGPSGVPWVERIADTLRNEIDQNLWQLYGPPPGPEREKWWEEQHRFFASASKAERAMRLERIVVDALPRLEGSLRVRALGRLLAIPGLENLLSDTDVDLLLSLVGQSAGVDPRIRALLEVVALKKGAKTWKKLLAFLAPRWDKGGKECFLALLVHSSPARIQSALSWKDPRVRAAGALYLGRTRNAVWRDSIRALLKDPSGAVRAAAVDALAYFRDWASLGDVLPLARKDPSLQVRRRALLFAGRSGDSRVLPLLLKALDSPLGGIRIAAIRALGLSQLPRAADVLAGLVASDPEGVAGRLAARELSRWGNGDVRAAVRPLLGSPSSAVREAALWILADSLDGTTIPRLLQLLRQPEKYRRARRALILLTCKEFIKDVAASYARWFETHGSEPGTAWFVEGLKDAGYTPGFGPVDLLPGAGLGAVPGLVAVMKDAREWYFRVQAARRLQEITGTNFGVVTARTSPAERAAIAQAWLGWLEDQKGKTAR